MPGIPSVINVTDLDGSNGFTIVAANVNETPGSSVAIGDVNGDGFADVIVGAPGVAFNYLGGPDYSAYVIFGHGADDVPVPPAVATSDNFDLSAVFHVEFGAGYSGDTQGGYAVSYAGDFNGDGVGDFMVSAPHEDGQQGATYVVFGKAGLSDANPTGAIRIEGGETSGRGDGDLSGYSVAAVGDVNGDGFDDVLISSPRAAADGRSASGVSYVVYGNASGANIDLANFNASEGFRIIGASFNDGQSVTAAGDVNGDGRMDFLIGDPFINPNGAAMAGSTYLVYGSDSGADVDLANLTPGQGVRFDGEFEGQTGFSVSAAGDINGDGLADVVIGAPAHFATGGAGSAYVIFGKAGGLSNVDPAHLAPGDGFRIHGAAAGDEAGYSVASAGDFNGDGFDDLIIGAPGADPNGQTDAGSAYVIFGKASGFGDIDLAHLNPADGFRIDGAPVVQPFDHSTHLGASVAGAGDINGDGYSDIVVGAPDGSFTQGSAYVIYGEASGAVNKTGTAGDDRLFGGDFDDTLSGGDGNDVLGGKDGNNVLTGGAGRDAFVYAISGQHHDVVTDFQRGEDVINLRASGISDFATLQQFLNDAQGNAVITTISNGISSTMTLTGISAGQLTEADFTFADDANSRTLTGSDRADDLFGGASSDFLNGAGGDDAIFGGQGYDTLSGGAGNDRLFGGQDGNSLEGGAGADLLDGGAGTDEVTYSTAQTGVTASLASGGTAGDAAGDVYVSIENMWGSYYDDVLEGDDQANYIYGLDGNNIIRGGGGDDYLYGGRDNDTFYGGAGADIIHGGGGVNYVRYDDAKSGVTVGFASPAGSNDGAGDVLVDIQGIIGSAFGDKLGGTDAAEDIQGAGGDDLLQGRGGNDALDGGDGLDQAVYSGSRSDYFVGFDTTTGSYVIQDLRQGSPDGTDHVRNVETFVFADGSVSMSSVLDGNPGPINGDDSDNTLTGTPIADEMHGLGGNDILSGLAGEDVLEGGDGNDVLDGGTGIDTASYASATQGVSVSLTVTSPQDTGGAGIDTLVSIENLTGSAHNDILTGNAGANALSGGAGDDILIGGAGADALSGGAGDDILIGGAGADAFDGGDGFDLVSYETDTFVVPIFNITPIDFSGDGGGLGDEAGDTFSNIEGVIGTSHNDLIVGRLGVADTIIGGAGNDVLDGQGGGDTLIGGVGNDLFFGVYGNNHFVGGDGLDTVVYFDTTGITADLADPSRNTGSATGDTYDGVENLVGSNFGDRLIGDTGDNVLVGGSGNDRLIGGAGADVLNGGYFHYSNWDGNLDHIDGALDLFNLFQGAPSDTLDPSDVASYETATSGVIASLSHSANNTGDAAGDTYVLIDGLAGSNFDDTLEGDQKYNRLEGGAGNDTLIGHGGGDDYDGGAGNDTVVLDGRRADYTISYDAASQTFSLTQFGFGVVDHVTNVETLQFSDGAIAAASLLAGDNNDNTLLGTAVADDLSGAGGNDTLFGFGGDDRIDGGTGNDVLDGGDGNDTLIGGDGRDAASYAQALAAVHVDLGVTGPQATGAGMDTLVGIEDVIGSAFDDTLIGASGVVNHLYGGAGNDLLIGVGDVLDGGAGNDTASFASTFGSIIDLAVSGPQSDGTVLINIENVIGSAASDILKGDGGNNWLMGGDGADTLMGRGGDDILDGGGSPADTASYAEAHSGVTVDLGIAGPQNTGEGFDTLIGIENLTGSAFADTLKGDAGDNNLTGGAGDDTLIGMGGQDQFHGGDGSDTVSYAGMTSGVTVDLNTISFQFINGSTQQWLDSIENVTGSAFADKLTGNAGANALNGGAGNDLLTGGLGHDMLTGGAGNDIFDFNSVGESPVGAGLRDIITDFQSGQDKIDLSSIDTDPTRKGDQDFRFIGTQNFDGRTGELHYQTFDQPGTANDITVISGDINGDRVADFEIELTGIIKPTSGDFLL